MHNNKKHSAYARTRNTPGIEELEEEGGKGKVITPVFSIPSGVSQ
jgi:hypothetical protein